MGRELVGAFPVFLVRLGRCVGSLIVYLGRSLREVVFAGDGSDGALLLDRTEFAQPALFALEVALYRLVESFGVRPDYLIGHSIGELAAAYVAGVLSLGDACALVAARGRLMGALPDGGAMLAVQASEREVLESLAGVEGVSVAAVNGPEAVVVSGEVEAIGQLEELLGGAGAQDQAFAGKSCFSLEVDGADARGVSWDRREFELQRAAYSDCVEPDGGGVDGAEATSPDYWVGHVRDTVRFADGVASLRAAGVTRFLELGPDGVLSALVSQCIEEETEEGALVAASLRAGRPEVEAFMRFLARAYVDGVGVDWRGLFDERRIRRVELPGYAFQRKRYWLRSGVGSGDAGSLGQSSAEHPLLGAALDLAGEGEGLLLTGRFSTESHLGSGIMR